MTKEIVVNRLVLSSSFVVFALLFAGCSCAAPCDFPVRCVDHCGGTESSTCGACPAGTIPISQCIDAAIPDAGGDASADGGRDASADGGASDSGTDASLDSGADTGIDAAIVCDRPGYPASSAATASERADVEAAVSTFTTSTGVRVDLDPSTAAVTGFSAPFPVTLDPAITDPCMRALAAIQQFVTDNAAMMRMPADMTMRACDYDSLTDAEIVRIHGGTYAGRRILGTDNDLVIHVTRSGTIRYWGGSYLPVAAHLLPAPCVNADGIAASVVGDSLDYMGFMMCAPTAPGRVTILPGDTRNIGEAALFVDASGLVHVARQIEVLLAASHVTPPVIASDLYCCAGTLDGCVGAYVIVDEIDLSILQQLPRCITC
jgi:hypothetical protein